MGRSRTERPGPAHTGLDVHVKPLIVHPVGRGWIYGAWRGDVPTDPLWLGGRAGVWGGGGADGPAFGDRVRGGERGHLASYVWIPEKPRHRGAGVAAAALSPGPLSSVCLVSPKRPGLSEERHCASPLTAQKNVFKKEPVC